jgi:hypothetical protein
LTLPGIAVNKSPIEIANPLNAVRYGEVQLPKNDPNKTAVCSELTEAKSTRDPPDEGQKEYARRYSPLDEVVRPILTTEEAAFYLNRKQQTLRIWASRETGPLRPVRVHRRPGWSTDDIRSLLGYSR